MWNCKHCTNTFEFNKTVDKANHTRWCNLNPKAGAYRNNINLEKAVQESKNKKYGKEKEFLISCNKCDIKFLIVEREKSFPSKEKYFCSRRCANSRVVSEKTKKKISSTLSGRIHIPPTAKICMYCNNKFDTGTKKQKFCSNKCSRNFRSHTQREQRTSWKNYRASCQFKFNLNDYPQEFDFKLIESYGWYKPTNRGNNLTGISRDHMVSCRYGFDNNIPVETLSHPANCKLLQHGNNVSKGTKNSITYDDLLIRIKQWDEKYKSSTNFNR
jgi:hypothetical protein